MGALDSKPIKEFTKEDISVAVANLGEPYHAYAATFNGNGVDGKLLDGLKRTEIEETLDDLDVANRLHRQVLMMELSKAKFCGEYTTAVYNYSPSTQHSDLTAFQQVTDKCLTEYRHTSVLAGVYLILDNGNQLSLDTKISRDGIITSEKLNCVGKLSICSSFVKDGRNQDFYKLLLPCDIQLRFFDDPLPMTLTGFVFKDELDQRQGMVCMVDRCSPSDLQDNDREAFLRPLASDIEQHLRIRKQQLLKTWRTFASLPHDSAKRFQLREESQHDVVLCAHGPLKPVSESQVRTRLSQMNPFHFQSTERRASHTLPVFQNTSTEAERAHLPLDFYDLVDQIGCPRPPIPKNDMECSAIVESLALTEINPEDAIAVYLKEMVKMATQVFGFPNGEISFRNHDTIFCLAGYGTNEEIKKAANVFPTIKYNKDGSRFLWKMPRAAAVCNFVLASATTFVLPDIAADESFQWLISGTPVRCYVGTAIKDSCGRAIAVLCMHDAKPRPDFEAAHEMQLEQMASLISQSIENWALMRSIERLENERKLINRRRDKQRPPAKYPTFVVTDVEGGIEMTQVNPTAMQRGQSIQESIIAGLAAKHYGYHVQREKYAIALVFHDPVDAFAFALQAQIELHEAMWPDDLLHLTQAREEAGSFRGLRVKMAVHSGGLDLSPDPAEVSYEGETLTITKNLLRMANGGQILSTAETWDVASYVIGSMLSFPQVLDHGSHVIQKGRMMRDGVITKRIIQLVPSNLAYDYFRARKLSSIPGQHSYRLALSNRRLPGRRFPPVSSLQKVSPSFHDAPFVGNEVTIAFVNLSEMGESEASSVVNLIGIILDGMPEFGGYQCQNEMLAFNRPLDAILFGLYLRNELASREPRQAISGASDVSQLLTYACIHEPFLTMGPHRTTGRADYFGKIVNRAARLSKAIGCGTVCLGIICSDIQSLKECGGRTYPIDYPTIKWRFGGTKKLKGVPGKISVYEYESTCFG